MPFLRSKKKVKQDIIQISRYPTTNSIVSWKPGPKEYNQSLHEDAFKACVLETGEHGYVAKAKISSWQVTGLTTEHACEAYIPYGCREHRIKEYQVLTCDDETSLHWVKSGQGRVPLNAVQGGKDAGEDQFIGRTCTKMSGAKAYGGYTMEISSTEGQARLGKIHSTHGCLYVPYNGREYIFPEYEVLCHKPNPARLFIICRWRIHQILHFHQKSKEALNLLPLPSYVKDLIKPQ